MKILYIDIRKMNNLEGYQLLNIERQKKIDLCKRQEDKLRSLAAGLLTRHALGNKLYKNLSTGPHGQPLILCEDAPYFSISHSGNYVILGYSELPLGIDIEEIKCPRATVAQKCYTEAEQAWLNTQDFTDGFYKLWTGKESIMKAYGLGFQMPPQSFDILPVTNQVHTIQSEEWFLTWGALDNCQICLCSKESITTLHLTRLDPTLQPQSP